MPQDEGWAALAPFQGMSSEGGIKIPRPGKSCFQEQCGGKERGPEPAYLGSSSASLLKMQAGLLRLWSLSLLVCKRG